MGNLGRMDDSIGDVSQLEQLLSRPNEAVIETMCRLEGDVLILGAGGKMGPTLARMVRRASDDAGVQRRVIGVGRNATPGLQREFQSHGIEWISGDLLDRELLYALPDVRNVVYMAGMKFGSTGKESLTWALNVYLPGMVCRRFRHSRIVAFSTGNVYGLSPVEKGGSVESDELHPDGDYAMSCLGRERMFSYFGERFGIPVSLLRLNYANEMRYGVLVDLARQVMTGEPVDVTMGYFNAIWQGDANAIALRAFDHVAAPPRVINVAGPQQTSVRVVGEEFGRLLKRSVRFTGSEAPDALLSNGRLGHELLGYPGVSVERMVGWIADWQLRGGPTLGKPTHFQNRDGQF